MAYSEKHKQFLQYFMFNRMVTEEDANIVNGSLFPEKDLDNTIELINTKIAPLEFKISKRVCEQDSNIYYAFIALFVDDFNCKTDPVKTLFVEIVNFVILSGGVVPYDEMIAKYTTFNTFYDILDNLFRRKYLTADAEKNIYLSPLAVSELDGYLVEKFSSKKCMGCMSVVAYGIQCVSCNKFIHGHCLTTYSKNIGSAKCPKCSQKIVSSWTPISIGVDI
ncbi:uncharacterized protein LOC126838610 [Adelges cooleyi]|uniref:uncharacterized protein LOC126838610 n=1 Tax=Adelges cooleyi TaxID=133065 RepID=UPI00217FB18B|nr:uncharacterized protein LOC126838610 [Adelges cooleyi]XP_050429113.1 uncharacterized protein LOC126838610 [Adelges cooleyi]